MAESVINVEVAFASVDKQVVNSITVVKGASVQQIINQSGILEQFSEVDLTEMAVGIFGKSCGLDAIVEQDDRVEIYRPLLQNPMDARRNRAVKGNT